MLLRLNRHEQAPQHKTKTQTFAALRPVVGIPRWAIAAFYRSRRVDAFAFAVAAAIIFQALVHA